MPIFDDHPALTPWSDAFDNREPSSRKDEDLKAAALLSLEFAGDTHESLKRNFSSIDSNKDGFLAFGEVIGFRNRLPETDADRFTLDRFSPAGMYAFKAAHNDGTKEQLGVSRQDLDEYANNCLLQNRVASFREGVRFLSRCFSNIDLNRDGAIAKSEIERLSQEPALRPRVRASLLMVLDKFNQVGDANAEGATNHWQMTLNGRLIEPGPADRVSQVRLDAMLANWAKEPKGEHNLR
jgi:hypothetical protein